MQILDIDTTLVSAEMGRHVSGSVYTKTQKSALVLTVETDGDATGQIYTGTPLDVNSDLIERWLGYIEEDLIPTVVGEDLFSIETLWDRMFRPLGSINRGTDRSLYCRALGAVDVALWDAIGKATGQPLYKLWGGAQDSLPVFTIGGYYEEGKTLEDLAEEMRLYEEMDLSGVKFKVGGRSVDRDIERLAAAREAVSEGFEIAVDANRGYTIEEAVEFIQRAEPYDVAWYEEPVVWYDEYRGMREVRNHTDVPVVAGQSEIVPQGCRRLIEEEAVDMLNYDATLASGATAWRRVAGFAALNDVTMGHHHSTQVGIQLMASVPHGTYAEIFEPDLDPIWYDMVENTPEVEDGRLIMPEEPGFGLDLDQAYMEDHEVDPIL